MDSIVELQIEKIKKEKDIFAIARMMKNLIVDKQLRVKELGTYLSMKSSYISNILRLLKLPDLVIDGYYSQSISLTHLIIISRLPEDEIAQAYEEILTGSLTTSQTQDLIREKMYNIKTKGDMIDDQLKEDLINSFKKIGEELEVKIIQTQIHGKVLLDLKGNRKKTGEFFEKLAKVIQE